MSEQIREQISAFLDGELPGSEAELLLKRLTRDADLRESFGRYALIGEALRKADRSPLRRGFAAGVAAAIDGGGLPASAPAAAQTRSARWWRPVAGAAVAASVAAVAVVALQQRAVSPALRGGAPVALSARNAARPAEALSYTVPAAVVPTAAPVQTPAMLPAARLTSYVFAHSRYSSVLGQSNVLSGLLADADEPAVVDHDAGGAPAPAAPREAVRVDP